MIAYFDSSALVKLYVAETGSAEIRELIEQTIPATARLSLVEMASALHRRYREGDLSEAERDELTADLRADASALYLMELSPEVVATAERLLGDYPLRASDAVQLASCLLLREWMQRAVSFVVFDQRLLQAAHGERLHTTSPSP